MKFVGNSSKEFLRLLMTSKKYNKYFEADAIIDVPDDYYDDLVGTNGSTGLIDEQISELLVKKKRTEEIGNVDATIKIEKKIEKRRLTPLYLLRTFWFSKLVKMAGRIIYPELIPRTDAFQIEWFSGDPLSGSFGGSKSSAGNILDLNMPDCFSFCCR